MNRDLGIFVVVGLALVGCPSSAPKDPTYTPAGPKPCERMADHLVGLMQPSDPETGKPIDPHPETADKISRVLVQICTDDGWTEDAQRCFLGIAAITDAGKCASLLTVAQRDAADRAMASAFGAPPERDGSVAPEPEAGSGSAEPSAGSAAP